MKKLMTICMVGIGLLITCSSFAAITWGGSYCVGVTLEGPKTISTNATVALDLSKVPDWCKAILGCTKGTGIAISVIKPQELYYKHGDNYSVPPDIDKIVTEISKAMGGENNFN